MDTVVRKELYKAIDYLREQVRTTWWEFIKSRWDVLAACDFFMRLAEISA